MYKHLMIAATLFMAGCATEPPELTLEEQSEQATRALQGIPISDYIAQKGAPATSVRTSPTEITHTFTASRTISSGGSTVYSSGFGITTARTSPVSVQHITCRALITTKAANDAVPHFKQPIIKVKFIPCS